MERERPRRIPNPDTTRFVDEAPAGEVEEDFSSNLDQVSAVGFVDQVGDDEEAPPDEAHDVSGVILGDVAQGASAEVRAYQDKLDAESAEAQAKRAANKKLPPRVVAKPAPMITVAADAKGQALCPECQAKNALDAKRCGRCGAEIPPAIPAGGFGRRKYKTFGERRDEAGDEIREVLPQWQLDRFADKEAKIEARMAAGRERWRGYRNRVVLASAAVFVVLGAVTTVLAVRSGWLLLLGFVVDALCGGVAGERLVARRGGTITGLTYFGLAGLASAAAKLAMGAAGMLTGNSLGAFIIFIIAGTLGASLSSGLLAGLMVEMQAIDES